MSSQNQPRFFDAPALLVEARFRDRTLCTYLLEAGAARGFTVGAGRAADAPIDVAYLPASRPANDNHVLVEPTGAGFLVNLPDAMRARLEESPTRLRVPCGEVIFDITAAAAAPPVPRPWLPRRWKDEARYLAGVAVGVLVLLGVISAVPSDPRSISLDDTGRMIRMGSFLISPPVPVAPPPVLRGPGSDGGGASSRAAAGPSGVAGDPRARPRDTRRATRGPATNQDPRDVVAFVTSSSILSVLGSQRASSLVHVLSTDRALGEGAEDVLGQLVGTEIASAYGTGVGPRGTGEHGGGTGEAMLPGSGLGTIPGGNGPGRGPRYGGRGVGDLPGKGQTKLPQISLVPATVRGNLDKDIIRRVVRTHLNEVRYCYEQSLVRRPSLAGRVVVQFTIASTGRVLVSALQSSSIAEPTLNTCIVDATRRWQYPAPDGGGLAIVSYPFQLTPAGG